jgi:hypothetical protein
MATVVDTVAGNRTGYLKYSESRYRLNSSRKNAELRHSEPAAAGEESPLGLCFESGGILRFAQNNDERAFFRKLLSQQGIQPTAHFPRIRIENF